MQKGTDSLSYKLLDRIHTTKTLKVVADALESMTQNKSFKTHATSIVADSTLTASQKKTQLNYLIRSIEIPVLYDFFSDEIGEQQFWVLNSGKIDYFDKFVAAFQAAIETVRVLNVATAYDLSPADLEHIAKYFADILGFRVVINHEVNPAIIGGCIVKIENYIFDISLRHKFQTFQARWLRSLESTDTQIGHDLVNV